MNFELPPELWMLWVLVDWWQLFLGDSSRWARLLEAAEC